MPLSEWPQSGKVSVQTSMEFTEREAAKYCLIPWDQYMTMGAEERSRIIAFYQSSIRLNNVVQELTAKRSG